MDFDSRLSSLLREDQIHRQERMSAHTTFKVGGAADYYLQPRMEEVGAVLGLCRQCGVPAMVVGNGSNLLVADDGIDGAVVEIGRRMQEIRVEGTRLIAQAGALLSQIASVAGRASLAGMEFAGGIPGTLGGALVMNAGAYGGEMKDVLLWATVLAPDGEIKKIEARELALSYRRSAIPQKGYVVLEAALQLHSGQADGIAARMEELKKKRMEKQPLDYPSAGSTFKRPEGHFAAKLIEDAGLKGYRIGDAQVSEKHSGFLINLGNATAAELLQLMKTVQDTVQEKFGVRLEPEVKLAGRFTGDQGIGRRTG